MLKFIFFSIALGLAYMNGYTWHLLAGWLAWSFLSKAMGGGGIVGGVQAVALKSLFLGLMIFATYSDKVGGSTAVGLFLLGAAGINFNTPTFRLSKQMQQGQARDRSNSAHDRVDDAYSNGADATKIQQAETGLEYSLNSEREADSGIGLMSVISFGMKRK